MNYRVYILGLRENFRGRDLLKVLQDAHIPSEVFFGLNAESSISISEARNRKQEFFFYGRELTQAEIACSFGHKAIYAKALRDEVELAIILEDDATIRDIPTFLNLLQDLKFSRPSLVNFGNSGYPPIHYRARTLRSGGEFKIAKSISLPVGAYAYAVNRSALIKIDSFFKTQNSVFFQADYPPGLAEVLDFYFLLPSNHLVRPSGQTSLIGNRNNFSKLKPGFRSATFLFLKLTSIGWIFYARRFTNLRGILCFFTDASLHICLLN